MMSKEPKCNICQRECIADIKAKSRYPEIMCVKHVANPILPFYRNAFGSVWRGEGNDYLYWCDFRNVYRSWRQKDIFSTWHQPLLCGCDNEWDSHIDCTMVFRLAQEQQAPESVSENMWCMLYRGGDKSGNYAVGLATSLDGCRWTKHRSNPVLYPTKGEWDGIEGRPCRIFDPWGIIKIGNVYHLWFNSETPEHCRCIGLATSEDLVNWKKDIHNPIFMNGRFCAFPFRYKEWYWLIVPAGGLKRDGTVRFELYRDRKPTFYPEDRVFINNILYCSGGIDSFDNRYIDTPCVLTKDTYRILDDDLYAEIFYTGEGPTSTFWRHGIAHLNLGSLPI